MYIQNVQRFVETERQIAKALKNVLFCGSET